MSEKIYTDGVLRKWWDDETRTYTEWGEAGEVIEERSFTVEENAAADAAENFRIAHQRTLEEDAAQRALIAASLALAPPPTTGGAWVQPTGDPMSSYAKGSIVEHAGKTWTSLTPFNVWEPGVSGWREEVAEGYPAWVQPTGAHDAYALGDRVTHNGQNWESTAASNVWAPGVFGWVAV